MTWRTTYFDNRVKNPVSNVSQNQAGTILMRNNLGKTRIRGLQTDVEYRLTPQWQVSAAYLYNQAKVTESTPATLVGKYLVQVPVHRGSVRVTFADPRYVSVSVGVQGIGSPVRRRPEHAAAAGIRAGRSERVAHARARSGRVLRRRRTSSISSTWSARSRRSSGRLAS
jgi:outer membrane receptor protein involved in Fe transport